MELSQALTDAWVDTSIGVVVFTGAGEKAFCTGGDQSIRDDEGYKGTIAALPLEVAWQTVTSLIRNSPTALKMLKYAFHAATDGVSGITNLGVGGLSLYYSTEESLEGRNAFMERASPRSTSSAGRELLIAALFSW
jgi:1,4-dihydroxy-2-naphthoyl-CoA synthase